MKIFIYLILSMLFGSVVAQTQIPEAGFNNWTANSTNVFYEPSGGWWTTLNSLATLGGPVTVYQTTDAHSGDYAAQLETIQWGELLIAGLLVSGNFALTEPYIRSGQPFADRPNKFMGWYKYTPVNGDSAGVGALLTRYNIEESRQDTVATAIIAIEEDVQTYTQFEIDFDYLIPGLSPDTIIIVLTSSGDGGNFQGQIGSTLIVDDLSLEYSAGMQENLMPELKVSVFPSPVAEQVTFKFETSHPKKLWCDVYALDGRLIRSFSPGDKEHKMDVSTWSQGKYILQVYEGSTLVSSAKFIVVQ